MNANDVINTNRDKDLISMEKAKITIINTAKITAPILKDLVEFLPDNENVRYIDICHKSEKIRSYSSDSPIERIDTETFDLSRKKSKQAIKFYEKIDGIVNESDIVITLGEAHDTDLRSGMKLIQPKNSKIFRYIEGYNQRSILPHILKTNVLPVYWDDIDCLLGINGRDIGGSIEIQDRDKFHNQIIAHTIERAMDRFKCLTECSLSKISEYLYIDEEIVQGCNCAYSPSLYLLLY